MEDTTADGLKAGPDAPPRRGSALVAVGTIACISLVAVAGIVVWARLAQPAMSGPDYAVVEDVPSVLADGSQPGVAPDAITEQFDVPVIAAARLDAIPDGFDDCAQWAAVIEEPALEGGFITPTGVQMTLRGQASGDRFEGPRPDAPRGGGGAVEAPSDAEKQEFRTSCYGEWADGGWRASGDGDMSPVDAPGHGGMSWGCCDASGLATASTTMAVADGTAWALHDFGAYLLAYDVDGLEAVAVSWRFSEGPFRNQPPPSRVLLLDGTGAVIEERFLGR